MPSLLGPCHCKDGARPLLPLVTKSFSPIFFFCRTQSVSSELSLPRFARCELSRLRCNGHTGTAFFCLCRIKRKENCTCSACGHQLQNLIIQLTSFWIVPYQPLHHGDGHRKLVTRFGVIQRI